MRYLKSDEIASRTRRVSVASNQLDYFGIMISQLVDAHCERPLGIHHAERIVELNNNLIGNLGILPVRKLDPLETTTGISIRAGYRQIGGGIVSRGQWVDVTAPANLLDFIDHTTGRIQIMTGFASASGNYINGDFGRFPALMSPTVSRPEAYHCRIEFLSGYFADTTLTAQAAINATHIFVDSLEGIVANKTWLTVGDKAKRYKVTAINPTTKDLTISPGLVELHEAGEEVQEVVPDRIKVACGEIIEDALTFEPNSKTTLSDLKLINEAFTRLSNRPLPLKAEMLLEAYKNPF